MKDSNEDGKVMEAARAEERKTYDREMDRFRLWVMLVAYCLHGKEQDAGTKILLQEPLTPWERRRMVRSKLRILDDALSILEKHYRIAAKYYLCHRLHTNPFRWIEGAALLGMFGNRTERSLRRRNGPQINAITSGMIDDMENLTPPPVNLYTARLAVSGRTCKEIADVLDVIEEGQVCEILVDVSHRNPRLAECWSFWRDQRSEEEGAERVQEEEAR